MTWTKADEAARSRRRRAAAAAELDTLRRGDIGKWRTLADAERKRRLAVERELSAIVKHNESAAAIRQEIYGLQSDPTPAPAWLSARLPAGSPGTPMTLWSDWHWDEVVRAEEVGGVNDFNPEIAAARLRRLVTHTIDLLDDYAGVQPDYQGIVVCLGGDIMSGTIHDELRETNARPWSLALADVRDNILTAMETLVDRFGQVFVPCVVGNHGRTTARPRAKGRVYENIEWNLYNQLELYFRGDERFTFHVPGETDAYFSVHGHRFLLTHGDSLGVKGGDGIIGPLGPIARGVVKVGVSERQIGRDIDTVLMGHWHTYQPRGDAVPCIVNGTLKGYDEFARLFLRARYARPSQALWLVAPKHGIAAQWPVYLDDLRSAEDSAEWVSVLKRRVGT